MHWEFDLLNYDNGLVEVAGYKCWANVLEVVNMPLGTITFPACMAKECWVIFSLCRSDLVPPLQILKVLLDTWWFGANFWGSNDFICHVASKDHEKCPNICLCLLIVAYIELYAFKECEGHCTVVVSKFIAYKVSSSYCRTSITLSKSFKWKLREE